MTENRSPLGRAWTVADRILSPVEIAAAVIAAAMMLAAMVLNTADALFRYALNSPLNFNLFVTENYLMVGLICMPVAWAFKTGGYIRITFMLYALPRLLQTILLRVGLLASGIYCAQLAWLGGYEWWDTYSTGSVDMGVYDWPWHWSWIWIPIGMGLLSLRLLLTCVGPRHGLEVTAEIEEGAA